MSFKITAAWETDEDSPIEYIKKTGCQRINVEVFGETIASSKKTSAWSLARWLIQNWAYILGEAKKEEAGWYARHSMRNASNLRDMPPVSMYRRGDHITISAFGHYDRDVPINEVRNGMNEFVEAVFSKIGGDTSPLVDQWRKIWESSKSFTLPTEEEPGLRVYDSKVVFQDKGRSVTVNLPPKEMARWLVDRWDAIFAEGRCISSDPIRIKIWEAFHQPVEGVHIFRGHDGDLIVEKSGATLMFDQERTREALINFVETNMPEVSAEKAARWHTKKRIPDEVSMRTMSAVVEHDGEHTLAFLHSLTLAGDYHEDVCCYGPVEKVTTGVYKHTEGDLCSIGRTLLELPSLSTPKSRPVPLGPFKSEVDVDDDGDMFLDEIPIDPDLLAHAMIDFLNEARDEMRDYGDLRWWSIAENGGLLWEASREKARIDVVEEAVWINGRQINLRVDGTSPKEVDWIRFAETLTETSLEHYNTNWDKIFNGTAPVRIEVDGLPVLTFKRYDDDLIEVTVSPSEGYFLSEQYDLPKESVHEFLKDVFAFAFVDMDDVGRDSEDLVRFWKSRGLGAIYCNPVQGENEVSVHIEGVLSSPKKSGNETPSKEGQTEDWGAAKQPGFIETVALKTSQKAAMEAVNASISACKLPDHPLFRHLCLVASHLIVHKKNPDANALRWIEGMLEASLTQGGFKLVEGFAKTLTQSPELAEILLVQEEEDPILVP